LLSRRFLLSLVVGLSLSTLASANSANVNMTFLHSGTGVYARTYMDHFSIDGGRATPAIFAASNDLVSTGKSRSAYLNGPLSGTVMDGQDVTDYKTGSIASLSGMNGTRFRTDNWAGARHGKSTPEPASLLLLSTGLIGIAGLVRRKLRA